MPGFLEPIWETVFRVATWSALIFGALSIGSAFVSAWVGWEITDATQKDADRKIKAADERIAEFNARTKEAEFKLEQVRKQIQPRRLDEASFSKALEGIAPKNFRILYVRDTSDAFPLASEIMFALLELGWKLSKPPLAIEDKDSKFPNLPVGSAMAVGAQQAGISIIVRNLNKNPVAEALIKGFAASFGSAAGGTDERLDDDTVIIVIAPRP